MKIFGKLLAGKNISITFHVKSCDLFLSELAQLDNVQKGTFEWISSSLVTAMEAGHWLVLDGANVCSASVLDRLNSVFEDGGQLVLSERGVLGEDVVTVRRHHNFRAFLIYDPSKGEISRAMRNCCVEIHVDPGQVSDVDLRSLQSFLLGPADLSCAGRESCERVVRRSDELQARVNKLTLVRQDVLLAGGIKADHHEAPSELQCFSRFKAY